MQKRHSVSFEDGIVVVRVAGMAAHDDHIAARDEALRFCREKHCLNLLVDLRNLNTDRSSTMDCFSFGESLARECPGLRIAHVLPKQTKAQQDVRFTSTVEANRGIVVGEFATADEAREWLSDKA